eukprot:CAMPEP_0174739260 /NCGR_PEP_ID=MMETSP1094-20130205/71309_1 /TAXON_ID=156173 /ORGANISM="Chrysochromulina brevifilum, Strain UTEX LB 985" /LENGTH=142 /DNA_ID=CAMNT_0015942803 /DNA_START=123 /DNA_END=548 /DNA_ORIENTATION=-
MTPSGSGAASKRMPSSCSLSCSNGPSAVAGVRKPARRTPVASARSSRVHVASATAVSLTILAVSSYPGSPPETVPASLKLSEPDAPAGPSASAMKWYRNQLFARVSTSGPSPGFGSRPACTISVSLGAGARAARAIFTAVGS